MRTVAVNFKSCSSYCRSAKKEGPPASMHVSACLVVLSRVTMVQETICHRSDANNSLANEVGSPRQCGSWQRSHLSFVSAVTHSGCIASTNGHQSAAVDSCSLCLYLAATTDSTTRHQLYSVLCSTVEAAIQPRPHGLQQGCQSQRLSFQSQHSTVKQTVMCLSASFCVSCCPACCRPPVTAV